MMNWISPRPILKKLKLSGEALITIREEPDSNLVWVSAVLTEVSVAFEIFSGKFQDSSLH
jgi:hypothetical protein